jgi:AsmA-like C-terminal region
MSRPAASLPETAPPAPTTYHQQSPVAHPRKRWWIAAAIVLLAIFLAAVILLALKWPFTRQRVSHDLEKALGARVQIAGFHQTFFPPGCIAEGVTLRASRGKAVVSIQRLEVAGSYGGMLHHFVPLIQATGARVTMPPLNGGSSGFSPSRSDTRIGKLVANQSVLEVASKKDEAPTRFQIHEFALWGLGGDQPMTFEIALTNPLPPGEISGRGKLGPWTAGKLAQTPLSGAYSFRRADLASIGGVRGTLASDGQFSGEVRNLQVQGSVDVPDFQVRSSTHRVRLRTAFRAIVNGTNGDVTLRSADSQFGATSVQTQGTIAAGAGDGKTAALSMAIPEGRIQDVLLLFISAPHSPMTGIASFRAKIRIPPGERPFLRKIFLEGDFGVGAGQFTNQHTQVTLNKLSAKATGGSEKDDDDPASVVSDLAGHVVMKDATATFTHLAFRVPGALARMHGTYNLESQRINLHGVLLLQEKLSNTTSGIKSVLLKPLEPFLKKNRRGGAKLAASITGTYSHPNYEAHPVSK